MIEIITTAPSSASAESLAHGLVAQRLAACVQLVGPITSFYHWQGNLEKSEEWRVVIKTLQDRQGAVVDFLHKNHPYDVPEITVHQLYWVDPVYKQWAIDETRS